MTDTPPTTVAVHTPPGRGGIAVLVLAGPRAEQILSRAFRPHSSSAAADEQSLRLGHLTDDGHIIDEAVVAVGGGREEINIHGGPAATIAAMHLLTKLGAEPVEAPAACPGAFPVSYPRWGNPAVGEELLRALPHARSTLVAAALTQQWSGGISRLACETIRSRGRGATDALRRAAERLAVMQRLLHPPEVVLAGPPNVGKSTLANALVGREVSVVHDAAGTTRDWVRELALLGGVPIYLTDTAGLWDASGLAEADAEAIRRARLRIEQADLVLLLGAGRRTPEPSWLHGPLLHVAAKRDVHEPFAGAGAAVSAVTGEGLDALAERIRERLGLGGVDPAAPAAFTDRQANLLRRAADAIAADDPARACKALRELLGAPVAEA